MPVIGIDPGLDGAIAFLSLSGRNASAERMPTRPGAKKGRDIDARQLHERLDQPRKGESMYELAVIELVHAMPKQGVTSSFNFGKGFGMILAVLECRGIPYQLVTPQQWKKVVLAGLGREKSDAIRWCRNRFPSVSLKATPRCSKDHDGMAESLALAEYARLILLGKHR